MRPTDTPHAAAAAEPVLTGEVVWPGDPRYDEARQDYNTRFDVHPRVIVFCRAVEDVRNAVRWATHHGVPIRPRCGRHSYEGWSLVQDGIVVDVSWMDGVEVNRAAGTARVQAGIDLWPLYARLWEDGVTIAGGSCPTVGVAGLTLGGGFGLLGRWLGLTCDGLAGLEMVTAAGDVVRASEHENADLFWASRGGGGGNFGVVTEFTFRVTPIDYVSIYNLSWTWDDLPAVLDAWQGWAPGADDRLTSILKLTAASSGSIASIGQLVGSGEELERMLQPLLRAAPPLRREIKTLPYLEAVQHWSGLKPDQMHWSAHWHGDHTLFKNTSGYQYQPFGPEAVQVIVDALKAAPNPNCLVQMDAYGGAVARVRPHDTAFFHREGVLSNLQFQAYWKEAGEEDASIAWVEAFRESLLPFTRGAYANYIDRGIRDWPTAYYGGNFGRLTEVKAAWDPGNVFHYPQSIPVAARDRE